MSEEQKHSSLPSRDGQQRVRVISRSQDCLSGFGETARRHSAKLREKRSIHPSGRGALAQQGAGCGARERAGPGPGNKGSRRTNSFPVFSVSETRGKHDEGMGLGSGVLALKTVACGSLELASSRQVRLPQHPREDEVIPWDDLCGPGNSKSAVR